MEIVPITDVNVIFYMLKFLVPRDVCKCRLVCRKWKNLISEGPYAMKFWKGECYLHFIDALSILESQHRKLIADGTWTMDFGLEILHIVKFKDVEDRISILFPDQNFKSLSFENALALTSLCTYSDGIIAFKEGLINMHDMQSFPNFEYIQCLFENPKGLIALRKRLITPKQIALFHNHNHVRYTFNTDYGLTCLEEGLITPGHIASISNCLYIKYMFSNISMLIALRKGLINPKEIISCSSGPLYFDYVLKEEKLLYALEKGIITFTDLGKMSSVGQIQKFFNGISLREDIKEK